MAKERENDGTTDPESHGQADGSRGILEEYLSELKAIRERARVCPNRPAVLQGTLRKAKNAHRFQGDKGCFRRCRRDIITEDGRTTCTRKPKRSYYSLSWTRQRGSRGSGNAPCVAGRN